MRFVWSLVLVLSLASSARAVEIFTANERAPTQPIFANGLDVYGRDAKCRACHALLKALNENLIPSIAAVRAKPRAEYGAYDDLIENALGSTCRLSATWHDATTRRSCETLMEDYETELAETYHRWIKKGGGVPREDARDARGGYASHAASKLALNRYDPEGWNWNWEVCGRAMRGACKEQLAMHELEEFEDDGAGDGETRKYRSEQKPPNGETVDGMLKVTAGTFHEEVVRRTTDVLVYVGFPQTDKWKHFYLASALGAVREMFSANETARDALEISYVDGTHNDVPPPYGSDSQDATVAMFPRDNKNWPRYMTGLTDGKFTPYDVLQFIASTSSTLETVRHATWLMKHGPRNVLHRKTWDEHDDL